MPRVDADGVELFYESVGEGTDPSSWCYATRITPAPRENALVWNQTVHAVLERHGRVVRPKRARSQPHLVFPARAK